MFPNNVCQDNQYSWATEYVGDLQQSPVFLAPTGHTLNSTKQGDDVKIIHSLALSPSADLQLWDKLFFITQEQGWSAQDTPQDDTAASHLVPQFFQPSFAKNSRPHNDEMAANVPKKIIYAMHIGYSPMLIN